MKRELCILFAALFDILQTSQLYGIGSMQRVATQGNV